MGDEGARASGRVVTVMIADIPPEGVAVFQEYEHRVLALLGRHQGRLERRLRTADELVEVHVVSFADDAGYQAYLVDPERLAHRQLLVGHEPTQRILEAFDVET
jgi:hypothetical protein